jgi:hypothetical protein
MKPTRVTREEILAMTPEELDELSAELQGWVKRSVSGVDTWCIDNAPYDLPPTYAVDFWHPLHKHNSGDRIAKLP